MTPMQIETLLALHELNRRSKKFKGVEEVAKKRLEMRYPAGGEKAKSGRYFGMYLTTTRQILEELTRKGYADQADRTLPGGGTRPYKITTKGKTKAKGIESERKAKKTNRSIRQWV